jgi:hypothetical protein
LAQDNISRDLGKLVEAYDLLVKRIDRKARESKDRAYGGVLRAAKGAYVEGVGENLIELAWRGLGKRRSDLKFGSKGVRIPLKREYLSRIRSKEVRDFIKANLKDYYYTLKTDIQVYTRGQFKIAVECKAYAENAMLKRILVDFTLLRQRFPNLSFVLLQLESQLGGDYSSSKKNKYGSPSTHTLLSYFDVDLNIITLLEGERDIRQPIHKLEFYKPLKKDNLRRAVDAFKQLLA